MALVVAAIVALAWANSPWDASYRDLWTTDLAVSLGERELDLDLRDWINDGLMAIFFFVVGLEIKRELVEGELRDRRRAMLPVCAALGGMLVPALIYAAFNAGGEGSDGWGIPMATDIAMAVGVLSLMGSRVSPSLKLFLLALAIVDDIGAILVIAVFYTDDDPRLTRYWRPSGWCWPWWPCGGGASARSRLTRSSAWRCGSRCTSRGSMPRSPVSCSG